MSDDNPTPEQVAACERAMDGLEAQADIWADEIDLVLIIKIIGNASRGLTDRMPRDIREGFINRQEANIDALVRQAYPAGSGLRCPQCGGARIIWIEAPSTETRQ